MKNKKIFVAGAGGFIGGHLVRRLLDLGSIVIAADIKPLDLWFQKFNDAKNYSIDLKKIDNCLIHTKDVDYIFNLACNMGGMGFIENNKAECMISVLINTHLLMAAKQNNAKKFFFSSSACVYNTSLQNKNFIAGLKENDAYPAFPEDGYGWEKLFSERMCRHFYEDFNLEVSIARFHNIYGPLGTYDGGREKAPAALCRKIAKAKIQNDDHIDIWGDGNQTRSFLYINDCLDGILKLFETDYSEPLNIGSDQQVSINQLADIICAISNKSDLKRNYLLDKPKGVAGRSSNNDLSKKILKWEFEYTLEEGLQKTYEWIEKDLISNNMSPNKFSYET